MAIAKSQQPLSQKDRDELLTQASKACEMLKVLSHEGRLLILCLLIDGEKTVTEIEQATAIAQATVSQHMSRLRLEGMVKTRRDGRRIFYQISDKNVSALIGTLHQLFCAPKRRQ